MKRFSIHRPEDSGFSRYRDDWHNGHEITDKDCCVTVCPTGAMYKAEDGTVIHDDDMCIGCKACMNICPYGVPKYDEVKKITRKCDACASLRAKGENPACVDACPSRALDFGEREELIAKYGPDLVKDLPILPDSKLTNPNTLIKAKPCALEEDFRELPT